MNEQDLLLLQAADQRAENKASIYADTVGYRAQYRVVTIALDTAKLSTQPYKLSFGFRSFLVREATDNDVSVTMRLSSSDTSQDLLTLKKNYSLKFPHAISSCELSWSAQASKTIEIVFFFDGEFATNQLVQSNTGGVTLYDGNSVVPQSPITASASATQIFASSTSRKLMLIQNNDSIPVFISGDNTVTVDSGLKPGIKINPGESFEWRSASACYLIAGSAGTSGAIGLNLFS